MPDCEIEVFEGQSLMEAMIAGGVYVSAACGGKGLCGKCGVLVCEGVLPVTAEDRKTFSAEQLNRGMRLSCMAYPADDLVVSVIQQDEEQFYVLGSAENLSVKDRDGEVAEGRYFIAVDLGTTTLALSLADEQGGVEDTYTGVNHQRAYGADVISRIQASNEGNGPELTASIREDLKHGVNALLQNNGMDASAVCKVVIAGNTTMGHLLMGYDCSTLGQVPFTPVNIDTVTTTWGQLFGGGLSAQTPVILMPGFSTFVGGDILSGLLSTGFVGRETPALFVDLGTNGEMAVGTGQRLFVTSTAAGPAFEGGNISCGMGSVAGAICSAVIDGEQRVFETLGGKPAAGICGTGVIEVTAELLKEELLDETGLLDEEYFDDGFPLEGDLALSQADIRQLQLAKAAVRAGVETLLMRYGLEYDQVGEVFLAGGFGVHLNIEKAVAIGLLPEELKDKVKSIGNSALAGALYYGSHKQAERECEQLRAVAAEVDLSTDQDFQEFYMDGMMFGNPE